MIKGRVRRISGPIIYVEGLGGAGLFDVVEVGEKRLVGEIIRLEQDEAVVQVYEDNTGLMTGAEACSTGRPLSALLGPGLLGTIYDGIQRPLKELFAEGGVFIESGSRMDPLDGGRFWPFVPDPALAAKLSGGEKVPALPGLVLGTVKETESISCKIMVPPGRDVSHNDGYITELSPRAELCLSSVVARSSSGREITLAQWWPVRIPRPSAGRLPPDTPLITGRRVIDLLFPLPKGGTAAIPGGFGTGKTVVQQSIAKWCDADVIIYIGCGERGNEMTEVLSEFPRLIDPRNNRPLMERTILIANTSNMPVAAREVSIYTGITLGEFYRDMGYHVAIMADSTSRWAEALRELSGRMEEMPAEEGFPAYLPSRLAEFYERAGRVRTLSGGEGSISIIGAVSPPGGDFSEPVTQHTKRFIRCFWALDRDLANARHYPAISWIDSYSEYTADVRSWWEKVDAGWETLRRRTLELLKKEQRLAEIVHLVGPDALPDDQRLVLLSAEIIKNGFLQQNNYDEVDMYCVPLKQLRILELILEFHDRALRCIELGAPLLKISSLSVREGLSRLKTRVKNDDIGVLSEFELELEAIMDGLEASYSTREVL